VRELTLLSPTCAENGLWLVGTETRSTHKVWMDMCAPHQKRRLSYDELHNTMIHLTFDLEALDERLTSFERKIGYRRKRRSPAASAKKTPTSELGEPPKAPTQGVFSAMLRNRTCKGCRVSRTFDEKQCLFACLRQGFPATLTREKV